MSISKNKIIYVVFKDVEAEIEDDAFSVMHYLKQKLFKKIEIKSVIFISQRSGIKKILDIYNLLRLVEDKDILYLTIDGSARLDIFTIIKIIRPKVKVIWEIHGFPGESLNKDSGFGIKLKKFRRRILSNLVEGAVCLDKKLVDYSADDLGISKKVFLPCYTDLESITRMVGKADSIDNVFSPNKFLVFWGSGSAYLRWHSLDTIEMVARSLYEKDKKIVLLIVGNEKWHKFKFSKNIVFIDRVSFVSFLKIVKQCDLCLALYNGTQQSFHLSPQKVVDYMSLGKPVIGTSMGQIKDLINNGKNGFLTANKTDDIVSKILEIKSSKNLQRKLSLNSLRTIKEKRDLPIIAPKFKLFVEQILLS